MSAAGLAPVPPAEAAKFYYGPVEGPIEKGGKNRKEIFPSLVNLKTGQIVCFICSNDLRRAIEALIDPVGSEQEDVIVSQFPYKNSSEISVEEFEARSLSSLHVDSLSECGKEDFVQAFIRTKNNSLEAESQEVCEIKPFDEIESEDAVFGPFYDKNDFTDDLSEVSSEIVAVIAKNPKYSEYRFLDANSFLAQSTIIGRQADFIKAIKEDAELAFRPRMETKEEREKKKRERGLSGFTCIESPELDSMIYQK